MKRCLLFFVVVLFCFPFLFAQNEVEFFGYFEPQYMGAVVKQDYLQLFSNKLRLDLKWGPLDNVTFAANINWITYHGKTEWNILDFLPESVGSGVPETLRSFYVFPFSDRMFLDNAYLKLAFKHFDLTLGKQQISLGTGYVWNPTDVFNIKDPLDPTYEQPGHNGLRLDVPIGTSYTLTALYAPGEEWKSSAKMIQLKGRLVSFDYTLIGVEKTWSFHDYTQFDVLSYRFLEVSGKRKMLGASTVGEIFGIGVWAEFAYNWMESAEDFYELVAGFDYTFDFQTYVMVEFYRNTLGKSDSRDYDLNDWMRLMSSEQKTIARDQMYALVRHPVTDLMGLGLSSVYNFSDGSFVLIPTLEYSLSDSVDIFAYFNINFGKEGTNFAKDLGSGGMIRARIYF
jgi:hypothetical protein